MNGHCEIVKTDRRFTTTLKYILGLKGSSGALEDRFIEWERFNTQGHELKEIVAEWLQAQKDWARRKRVLGSAKGRNAVNIAYHLTFNEVDANRDGEEQLQFVRTGIWEWLQREFYPFRAIIAYHFAAHKFHTHILLSSIPLPGMNEGRMLTIKPDEKRWLNSYIRYVLQARINGLTRLSQELGYMPKGSLNIGIPQLIAAGDLERYPQLMEGYRKTIADMRRFRSTTPRRPNG